MDHWLLTLKRTSLLYLLFFLKALAIGSQERAWKSMKTSSLHSCLSWLGKQVAEGSLAETRRQEAETHSVALQNS